MSAVDADLLRGRNTNINVLEIPNGVDIEGFSFSPQTNPEPNIIFVGNMDYSPNVDAVIYFCNEVLPLLLQENDQYHFYIVGIHPRDEVLALASPSVTVTGMVDSVVPWYGKAGVCVVPLRAGGGTRLKILESIALGCPVVSTTVGAEGLDLVEGEHLLIADDAASFAEKISSLYADTNLRQRLIHAGYKQVSNLYGWDSIAEKLLHQYQKLQEMDSNEK
jgi:glycosyltransferase involved in cell wall biosynthesis